MSRSPVNKWRQQLNRILEDQLLGLIIHRHIFCQAQEVWKPYEGKYDGGQLSHWMANNYLAYATTAVRRATEPVPLNPNSKHKTLSLVILLHEIADNNHVISREWYLSMYRHGIMRDRSVRERYGGRDFSKLVGKVNAQVLPCKKVRCDIAALVRVREPIKRFTDKVVAHTESDRRKKGRPTWGKLNSAIDRLVNTFQTYHHLLNGTPFNPLEFTSDINVSTDLKKIWPGN